MFFMNKDHGVSKNETVLRVFQHLLVTMLCVCFVSDVGAVFFRAGAPGIQAPGLAFEHAGLMTLGGALGTDDYAKTRTLSLGMDGV